MSYKSDEMKDLMRAYVDCKFEAGVQQTEPKLNYNHFVRMYPSFKNIPLDTENGQLFQMNCKIAYAYAMTEKIKGMRKRIVEIYEQKK